MGSGKSWRMDRVAVCLRKYRKPCVITREGPKEVKSGLGSILKTSYKRNFVTTLMANLMLGTTKSKAKLLKIAKHLTTLRPKKLTMKNPSISGLSCTKRWQPPGLLIGSCSESNII